MKTAKELRVEYQQLREHLQGIPKAAQAAGRTDLTASEMAQVKSGLERAEQLRAEIGQADIEESADMLAKMQGLPAFRAEAARLSGIAASMPGASGGSKWGDAARQLKETGKYSGGLKAVTIAEPSAASTAVIPGITPLSEDERWIYGIFPSSDNQGSLAVTDCYQSSRGLHAESTPIQRAPLDSTPKAEWDIGVAGRTIDLAQFALMSGEIPVALFGAELSLEQLLSTELQRQLYRALDQHVVAQIAAASVPHGVTGTTPETQVREAITAMQAEGIQPDTVVLNPADSALIDVHTTFDAVPRFPYGLRIVVSPDATAGAPLVVNTQLGGHLFMGPMEMASDPYTFFGSNGVQLRCEFEAVFSVRNAEAFYVAGPSS